MSLDPFTAELQLCGLDGTIDLATLNRLRRIGRLDDYTGPAFPCTGSAHLAGEHFRCTSPAHQPAPPFRVFTAGSAGLPSVPLFTANAGSSAAAAPLDFRFPNATAGA